nr:PREDICTED: phosphoribosyl pyrophosphate synthase-associated protein 1 isoform X3 [Equus przewalskii]
MPKKLLLLPPLSASSAFRAPRARPAARPAMNAARTGYRVFSANSTAACTELAKRITERLGAELGKSVVYQETNGETRVEIKESVRGQDIFIIQTIPRDVNTAVMELLIMAYALKTACARNIIGVIPYFPYSKQSKMRKRGSIVCKLLASMLAKAGLTHIITMDLHQKEIQGFFSFPVDNLRASPFLLQYIQEEVRSHQQTPHCPQKRPHVVFLWDQKSILKAHQRVFPLSLTARGSQRGPPLRHGGTYFLKTLKMDFLLSIFSSLLMLSKMNILRIIFYLLDVTDFCNDVN